MPVEGLDTKQQVRVVTIRAAPPVTEKPPYDNVGGRRRPPEREDMRDPVVAMKWSRQVAWIEDSFPQQKTAMFVSVCLNRGGTCFVSPNVQK